MTQKLTPMFEQYLRIKEEHPDALLFFRMGDFYELFFEDAEIAARDLSIALTCRNPNSETKVPMCGVPHHAAESYLSQLLEKGRKVAVCDQIEDPRQAKGLVKRAVTRVLTPGAVVEDSNLQSGRGNFLAALYWNADKNAGGLAWLDYSTGECSGLQTRSEAELWQWVQKIDPKELLLTETQKIPSLISAASIQATRLTLKSHFSLAAAKDRIFKAQNIKDLSVVDLADKPELTQALGAVVAYLIPVTYTHLTLPTN